MDPITYNKVKYTEKSIAELSIEDATALRNAIAAEHGLRSIVRFASGPKAIAGATAALEQVRAHRADNSHQVRLPGADGKIRELAERGPTKCDEVETVKRPTAEMFYRIKKLGTPTSSQRATVWDRYEDGMRLIDVMETAGLHAGKVRWWMKQEPPLMSLEPISDEQVEAEMREWYAKHDREYPGDAKAKAQAEREAKAAERNAAREAKAKEREEAKAKREEERKAKAEAREAAKAEKAAQREAAKAERAKEREAAQSSRREEMEKRKAERAKKKAAAA